jgi:uncharacterized glyoxalase superfamily metalloenzyme YdcJ
MENINEEQQKVINQLYEYAANLMIKEKKDAQDTQKILVEQGLDAESAAIIVSNLEQQIESVKKDNANKDMLYGALWCIGGIIATAAHIGYIFWGAILFGGIQFFRGLLRQ